LPKRGDKGPPHEQHHQVAVAPEIIEVEIKPARFGLDDKVPMFTVIGYWLIVESQELSVNG